MNRLTAGMWVIVLSVAMVVLVVCAGSVKAEMVARKATSMIVVHHSATSRGNVEVFRRHHVDVNRWDDVGYHYVITNGNGGPDGEIQTGRKEHLQGAHAGKNGPNRNSVSVGICLVGEDSFTDQQRVSLVAKLVELCRKYDISPSEKTIQPHHGDCPGKGLDLKGVIKAVEAELSK